MCPPEEEENNGSTPPKKANRVAAKPAIQITITPTSVLVSKDGIDASLNTSFALTGEDGVSVAHMLLSRLP